MPVNKLRVAIISAGRMASTIDDEIRSSETWPSLKWQLPYSHAPCYKSFDAVDLPETAPASSHLALVEDLIDCVKNDGTPLANEVVARNGMEILMGAAESHLQGGRSVELPLENRSAYIPSH